MAYVRTAARTQKSITRQSSIKCTNTEQKSFKSKSPYYLACERTRISGCHWYNRQPEIRLRSQATYYHTRFKVYGNKLNHLIKTSKRHYYPTALRRVQITPKTSTNITRYLYYRGPVRQVSCRWPISYLDFPRQFRSASHTFVIHSPVNKYSRSSPPRT